MKPKGKQFLLEFVRALIAALAGALGGISM